jgi:hypothetical protein
MVFAVAPRPCGWLTGGLVDVKGLEGENGVKKGRQIFRNKKNI